MDDAVNLLESLPRDVLVNHSDLRQLLLVSKPVKEATIDARDLHFKFSTPLAKSVFRDEETGGDDDDCPCAPKQHRAARSRLRGQNLESIAVNLSASFESMLSEV